jgi:hypothetical protein
MQTIPPNKENGLLKRFRKKIRHPATRYLLPLFVLLFGGIWVFSSEFLAQFASGMDAKLARWWVRLTGWPIGDGHITNKLFTEHFFGEIGIALMVAGLIAIFVEFIFRSREEHERVAHVLEDEQRHQRHVFEDEARHERQMVALKESVFKHVLGTFAPSWLSDKVVDLYKARVLRKNVKVTYTFEALPGNIERLGNHKEPSRDDLLNVAVHIHYSLTNLTDELADSEIEHGFTATVPLSAASACFTSLEVRRVAKGDELSWKKGETNRFVECYTPSEEDWKKSRRITVAKDFQIRPKETLDVSVHLRCVRWRYDHATWITRIPADGLTIIVDVEDCPHTLGFSLETSHPKPFKPVNGSLGWTSDGPLLPFQGFTLHWFLKAGAALADCDGAPL